MALAATEDAIKLFRRLQEPGAPVADIIDKLGEQQDQLRPEDVINNALRLETADAIHLLKLVDGLLGGSVTVDEVLRVAQSASERTSGLDQLLAGGVNGAADMDRDDDGDCLALSVGVAFAAVPVFTF